MNELDKMAAPEEAMTPQTPAAADCASDKNLKEEAAEAACVVTTSPSLDIEAVADAAEKEDACVEESSPALDIEAVADEADEEDNDAVENSEKGAAFRKIHAMDKEELLAALKEILDSDNMEAHKEVTSIKHTFFNIRSREQLEQLERFIAEGNAPENFSSEADPLEAEFKELFAQFKSRRAAYLEAEEARRQANLAEKRRILDEIRKIASDIDNINMRFPEFRQLQADFKAIKDVPPTDETEIWKSFQSVTEEFYDHLKVNKQLRDLDFKKNLESKQAIIDEAKELEKLPDTLAAFRGLQLLHDKWRELGPVAKELRESIWEEFKTISTVINKRHQEFFEERKAREQANEEGKQAIISEIEAITATLPTSASSWEEATKKVIELQKKWKEYGYASRKANTELYARYRELCDNFFDKKTEYYKNIKEELSKNLARKEALCEQAEALKDEPDARKAIDAVVKLQAEWKTAGSVPRRLSDSIWERFTSACNAVFERRRKENSEKRQEENANLAAKKNIIEQLKALPKEGERKELLDQVRKLQQEWQEAGFVPFKMKDKIYAEYREVVDAIYDAINSKENRRRLSNFKKEVSGMKGDTNKVGRERDRLVRVLEAKKNDLKNIENNIGFFNVKSSAGNSLVKDMERRMKKLREEMAEVEEKIALLDKED